MSAVQGRRISGGFIIIAGQDGIRYRQYPVKKGSELRRGYRYDLQEPFRTESVS
jgi:hypothetical protein